jgi:hypothetical protein
MAFPQMPPVNFIRQLKMFNDGVPRRMRFWLIVMFALFYQFAGGIYLASLSQMVGELGLLSEDVTMGGYCTLIGLNIIFPMLFRWKFGLYTRQLFFVATIVIMLCSVCAMYVTSPVAFWVICVVAGYFKMLGMFGCMSTIQLNITPTRNFAVFFPVIYILTNGAVQLSGLVTAYVTYYTNWRMMNLVVMAMMLVIDFIVYFFMKHDHRSGPYIPLKGIDWWGQVLWILVCCVAAWIFTFGEHYDWWDSIDIWRATFLLIALFAILMVHSVRKKDAAYIDLKAFGFKSANVLCLLLLGIGMLHSSAHVMQPVFLSMGLQYDALNIISLNYPELCGIIMGSILAYFVLVRWRWGIKCAMFLIFFLATYYALSMYYICDFHTDKETMYLAMFALGMSEVMMDCVATYYLSQTIPFKYYFTNITIIGFARCGLGTSAAAAVVRRLFNWSMAKNMMIASEGCYNMSNYGDVSLQGLMMSLQECYGLMVMLGIVLMACIALANFRLSITRFLPSMMAVRAWMTGNRVKEPTM